MVMARRGRVRLSRGAKAGGGRAMWETELLARLKPWRWSAGEAVDITGMSGEHEGERGVSWDEMGWGPSGLI